MNRPMPRFRLLCRHSGLRITVLLTVLLASSQVSAEPPPSFPLTDVVKDQATRLAAVDSNAGALAAFTGSIGEAIGLRDVAGTVGAKAIPAKMAKELGVADLSLSVQRLMAALAAWHLADAVTQQLESSSALDLSSVMPTAAREAWLTANGPWAALPEVLRLTRTTAQPESTEPNRETIKTNLALAATRLALEASQRATALWWDLQSWKERVRNARGRARLCGTWHWVIHNHQNHGEQKTSMIFLPSGQERPGVPAPAEIVVLGDSVYLRWEMNGRVQEDSLLFIKDGSRLEGSFVNNAGGWGSITGKRTAACQP
jgi:hypothetical protein